MASPPFSLNNTVPGDTDTVSQFPLLDRSDKGVISSWILTDHNVDGTHNASSYPQVGTTLSDGSSVVPTPTPAAGRTAIYRDVGGLRQKNGDTGAVEFLLGVPPGAIVMWGASAPPTGWLICDGSAVSRSAYANLFTAISTTFGAGDGSTTFNLPDMQNRVPAGRNTGSGARITSAGGNFDGTVLGATQDNQSRNIAQNQLPNVAPSCSASTTINQSGSILQNGAGSVNSGNTSPPFITFNLAAVTATSSCTVGSINGIVTQQLFSIVQPTIILSFIIRT